MKICYISNSAAPSKNASKPQITNLCEAISKIGHKVNLVLLNTYELDKNHIKKYK